MTFRVSTVTNIVGDERPKLVEGRCEPADISSASSSSILHVRLAILVVLQLVD
jgi:hypothetical protein